jgi:hypothetical protein
MPKIKPKNKLQRRALESLNEVMIAIHDDYLFIERLKYKIFKDDGHEPLRLKIAPYRAPGKYVNPEFADIPLQFSCSQAKASEVRDKIVQINTIYLTEDPTAIDLVYPWFHKNFGHILRAGSRGAWKDVEIPAMTDKLRTRNLSNGRICVFQKFIIVKDEQPIMLLTQVDGHRAELLKESDLWDAVGDMANNKCVITPDQIKYTLVCKKK